MNFACNNFFHCRGILSFFVRKFVFFFFYFLIFWLYWVFPAVWAFFLVAVSRGYSPGVVHRLLTAVASLVVEQGCGAWRLQ